MLRIPYPKLISSNRFLVGLSDIVGSDNFSTGESTLKLHSHDESYHRWRINIIYKFYFEHSILSKSHVSNQRFIVIITLFNDYGF